MAQLSLFLAVWALVAYKVNANPVVNTTAGEVHGFKREVNGTTCYIFAGIPYAEPPSGTLRFRAPVAKTPWRDVFNATKYGPSCPQDAARITAFLPDQIQIPSAAMEISEDCLTLNVYTPSVNLSSNSNLAVVVWIHGGSYRSGLGSAYDASYLAVMGDLVVVTMNYRLGPFGFLYTGDEHAQGNFGLLDQQLALQWVQDNIQAFGGDPSMVTLVGQSDVHGAPTLHMFAKGSRALFHRVVAHSGVVGPEGLKESAEAIADTKLLAQLAGCPSKSSGPLVECLRRKQVEDIVKTVDPYLSIQKKSSFAWRPVSTSEVFVRQPGNSMTYDFLSIFNSGDGSVALELMKDLFPEFNLTKGSTEGQWQQWLDVNIDRPKLIDKAVEQQYVRRNESIARMRGLFDAQFDRTFCRYGVESLRTLQPLLSSRRLMIFDHRSSSESRFPEPYDLVPHGAELPYVFGLPFNDSWNFTDDELELSRRMIRYLSNFAKTGDPNTDDGQDSSNTSQTWPEYGDTETYVTTNVLQEKIAQRYRSDRVYFWCEYLDELEASAEAACPARPVTSASSCEDPVIGKGLGFALTVGQAETLIEAFIFLIIGLLCVSLLLVGAMCGYKYRHRAISQLDIMQGEEGALNKATEAWIVNPFSTEDGSRNAITGSASDHTYQLLQRRPPSRVTFSEVDVEVLPPPPDNLITDDTQDGLDDKIPSPPETVGDEDEDADDSPPTEELEELNLSDEFHIDEDGNASSPATTVSAGVASHEETDPDEGPTDDDDDDGDANLEADSEPTDDGDIPESEEPAGAKPDRAPLDDFHSLNRRLSSEFYNRLESALPQ
ncbi:fatty acyl-CoA hydrolase precursor, medium chain-like [Acanthaster planci]|uniref:Fatty acyl-CoA hydrolase precursor, medium chain-like n=1 Tax=Acanthaster planci TaxID=133434 RepID=A0A8B7Y9D9_ACAPL|nr:fatty acyl-CoA hydrolase precursor, medium chain-like [Acanthaster planci]